MLHVGVDLHKRVSQVALLTADGELTQHRLANELERVRRFFEAILAPAPVAIEASGTWWWLVAAAEGLPPGPLPRQSITS